MVNGRSCRVGNDPTKKTKESSRKNPTTVPLVIRRFTDRFSKRIRKQDDVFFVVLTSTWTEFFSVAYCFVNFSHLSEERVSEVDNFKFPFSDAVFTGHLLEVRIWGSDCWLVRGELRVPSRAVPLQLEQVCLLAIAGQD